MCPPILLVVIPSLVLTVVDDYSVNKGNDALACVCEGRLQPTTALQEKDSALKEIRFRMAGVWLDQMPAAGSCHATILPQPYSTFAFKFAVKLTSK
jgi:hypothetical protein